MHQGCIQLEQDMHGMSLFTKGLDCIKQLSIVFVQFSSQAVGDRGSSVIRSGHAQACQDCRAVALVWTGEAWSLKDVDYSEVDVYSSALLLTGGDQISTNGHVGNVMCTLSPTNHCKVCYQQSKEASTKQPCKHCSNQYLPQGIKQHKKSCEKEVFNWWEQEKHNRAYMQEVHQAKAAKEAAIATSLLLVHPGAGSSDSTAAIIPMPPTWLSVPPSQSIPRSPTTFTFNEDDILMGTASPCGSDMLDPDFCQQNPKHVVAPDSEPWHPFTPEGNYIFATIAVEAGLTSTQVDSLLALVHCIRKGTMSVMLVNDAGLHTTLDRAASQLTPSTSALCGTWALDLLQNPSLTSHFVWDAQWLFKHDAWVAAVPSLLTLSMDTDLLTALQSASSPLDKPEGSEENNGLFVT
ncbi:hypothetical protein F5141DRAFT_1068280 [Pisolithus sp. B1]|nr:hypothetical protein F5141DRAFT_1068280 [Pisolithus sp. B1]